MIRRPPRSTPKPSSAASDVYKRQCQLREVHHSLPQSLNPWSRTQSAATYGSPACCTSSLMLRVCIMLKVLPSQSSVRSLFVLLLYEERCLSCLARPVWGTIQAVAEAFCLGQMLGALSANNTERQNLPQLLIKTYLRRSTFLPFFPKGTANIAFGTIFEEVNF